MFRIIIKLAIAALVANAAWRVGSAYATFYKFKDAVEETAQFGADRSVDQLRQRILDLASQYELPITDDSFTIRREGPRTYVRGSYTKQLEVVPGYRRSWLFSWDVQTLNLGGLKLQLLILK